MDVVRRPLAKIEGRKRMQVSGLTVAWRGTRKLRDWVAYLENGSESGRLLLADQVSERSLKSLLARMQNLPREELESLGQPVEAVAAQGGGPPVGRPRSAGGETQTTTEIVVPPSPPRQLMLDGETARQPAARRRRPSPAGGPGQAPAPDSRRAVRASARDLAGTVRHLRSRLESLEHEHHLRAELAQLRGDADPYEGPTGILVTGWFRATLVLILLAIVLALTVPWLMDFFEWGSRGPEAPARTEASDLPASPAPGQR